MTDIRNLTSYKSEINPLIIQAAEITRAYKEYENAPLAVREAMCLKKQYPALLKEIEKEGLFAGRVPKDRILYVGSIWWMAYDRTPEGVRREGKQGGYCFDFGAIDRMPVNEEERAILTELAEFWKDRATMRKEIAGREEALRRYAGKHRFISGDNIGFSIAVDLDRLVRRGLPGLREDVAARRQRAQEKGEETSFYDGLETALDILADTCRYYEEQARTLAGQAEEAGDRERLLEIARTLQAITVRVPESLREAIQLVWIYTILAGGKHLEAWGLDVVLGDLYVHDMDHGILTEEEAVRMIEALWRLYNENGEDATCRIMIGGKGRRNEANADRFAYAAMEATGRHKRVTPQLALRFYKGQDPGLLKKAYDTINESGTFPLLYNDDVVIPGVAEVFNLPEEAAEHYHPLGCGEYMIASQSPSLLDCVWNIPMALEAALRDGRSQQGEQIGPKTGTNHTFDTFDKLYHAFLEQIRFGAELVAKAYENICRTLSGDCAFLYASLLTDDCLERGKPIMGGGVRYLGGCVMGHGYSNAADSLTAIKKLVYDEKLLTLDQLVTVLDEDFAGREEIRRQLLDAPKYGNDNDEADRMHRRMWVDVHGAVKKAGEASWLDFLTASSVNPGGHGMGFDSGATADGRRKGQAYAIGNSPTAGADRSGLTALLNSLAKVDPANGGSVSNIKLSREFFTEERPKLEALFGAFFAKGGMQANITVVNRGDLEAALKEPEKYSHILVRLGGWTARFVDLERRIQEEILNRTLY
ncbi:pyruvate-formate lyase [Anaerotaenia torta]|uniref:pyruvate formate lyase family protein n=1 Tax=Anaerotaenia torta TaxID=433293 RepID=UPI003D1BC21B